MYLEGLVLAAGEGSRLRPFTYSRPKHLIPLLGKPLIQYPIEDLVSAGVRDVYLGSTILLRHSVSTKSSNNYNPKASLL